MAQIVFSSVGQAIGQQALPQGLTLLGRQLSGAAIGKSLGNLAGRAVGAYFAPAQEGPRACGRRAGCRAAC